MSKGINKAIIVGTLGQDPEVKATASGSTIVNVSVATNESWKDKKTGEKQEHVEWHRIVMFNKLAEIAAQYLKKGSQVYLEGRIQTRKWQDKDNNARYTTEIVADQLQMLGGKDNAAQSNTASPAPDKQNGAPIDDGFADESIPF